MVDLLSIHTLIVSLVFLQHLKPDEYLLKFDHN